MFMLCVYASVYELYICLLCAYVYVSVSIHVRVWLVYDLCVYTSIGRVYMFMACDCVHLSTCV